MSVPDLPTDHWVLRTARPGFSVRIARRVLAAQLVLATLTLGAVLLEITVGGGTLPLRDVLATLVGHGDSSSTFVIQELREPRALTGLFVGVAFGVSGAIVQGLTRNPLGSPDVLGLSAGASVGAVLVLLATDGTTIGVTGGALAGGLIAAVAVYALAWRQGMHGDRLVLVGIALGYALAAVTSFLISRVGNMEAPERHRLAGRQPQRPRLGARAAGRAGAAGTAAAGLDPVATAAGARAGGGRPRRRSASPSSARGSRCSSSPPCSQPWRPHRPARSPSSP